ncbi:MAG: hypothetical protein ACRDLO_09405 [Solirubrobacterales bacterium]
MPERESGEALAIRDEAVADPAETVIEAERVASLRSTVRVMDAAWFPG